LKKRTGAELKGETLAGDTGREVPVPLFNRLLGDFLSRLVRPTIHPGGETCPKGGLAGTAPFSSGRGRWGLRMLRHRGMMAVGLDGQELQPEGSI
jgi:hypothetical protein